MSLSTAEVAGVPGRSLAAMQDPVTRVISVGERATPSPMGTQVLVRMQWCGVCAADAHLARRNLPYMQATVGVFGHEGVGTIARLGPDVDGAAWRVGEAVGVRWLHRVCGACEACATGHENLCGGRVVTGRDVEGAFAQFALADAAYLVRLPGELGPADYAAAAPVLCAGVTVYKALRVADLRPGSWVAVAGAAGGLGHLGLQYARAMGLRPLALDVGAGAEKRAGCLASGAEAYVDGAAAGGDEAVVADVVRISGGGVHGALVCAPSSRAYGQAVAYLRRAGTLVCIAAPVERVPLPVLPDDFIARGIRIVGSSTGSLRDTEEALAFVTRGDVRPRVEERQLGEVDQAIRDVEAGRVQGRLVVRIPQSLAS